VSGAWLVLWEILWLVSLRVGDDPDPHVFRALVQEYGYVHLLLPVLLAFGLPALGVAFLAFRADDASHRMSLLRCVLWGASLGMVGAAIGFFGALATCTTDCI
jgi:hypothetical protein